MKNIKRNLKGYALPLGMVCLLGILLNSCAKSHDAVVTTPLAGLSVINASPDAGAVDFYIGSSKINMQGLNLGSYTYYFSVYSGPSSGTFYAQGTTSIVGSKNLTLAPSTYYTLFLANVKASPDLILLKDSVYKPAAGFTGVRFVDVSPDAPNIDVVIKGGTKLVNNASYKSYTGFLPVPLPSGTAHDTLQVVQTGTTNVLATVPVVDFISNANYTVWFYGLANTTVAGQGLAANIMEDVYFN